MLPDVPHGLLVGTSLNRVNDDICRESGRNWRCATDPETRLQRRPPDSRLLNGNTKAAGAMK